MDECITFILAICFIIAFTIFFLVGTMIILNGYAKIDNVCADLGIKSIIKCGIIDPAFQSEDIQNRLEGNLRVEIEQQ